MLFRKQIDSPVTIKKIVILTIALAVFYIFSEVVLSIFKIKATRNDLEYYMSLAYSREEWKVCEEIIGEMLDFGPRTFYKKDTIIYLYKQLKSKHISMNSDGIRGPEITPKKDGEFRIALLGASITWGELLPDDKTIPVMLEKMLRDKYPGKNITVYNLGIEGFDLQRDIALAKYFEDKIKPDAVIFYNGAPDIHFSYLTGYVKHEPYTTDGAVDDAIFNAVGSFKTPKWYTKFKVSNLVANSIKNEKGLLPSPFSTKDTYDEKLPGDLEKKTDGFASGFYADMVDADRYFKQKNIKTVFAFMPNVVFREPKTTLNQTNLKVFDAMFPYFGSFVKTSTDKFIKKIRADGTISFYDFSSIYNNTEGEIFFDVIHINYKGADITTREFFNIIEKEKIIPD